MTAQGWWVVAFLAGAVIVVGWPIGLARRRWTRRDSVGTWLRPLVASVRAGAKLHPRRTIGAVAVLAGACGWVAAGPVAAGILGTYAAWGVRAVLRRLANQARAAARARLLDEVGALAADLRAGLPAAASGDLGGTDAAADVRLRELAGAGWRLAERTGAPVADLIDRIEADARAADRARAGTLAQVAGARATALLLAGLPVGGIALGYAIGADPLAVLLHTTLGAACALGAILLQLGGLVWADRLAGAGTPR